MLWLYQRTISELRQSENAKLKDLNFREVMTLAPIIACCLWIASTPSRSSTSWTSRDRTGAADRGAVGAGVERGRLAGRGDSARMNPSSTPTISG